MRLLEQHAFLLSLLGIVLLAPMFDLFDDTQDIQHDKDVVLLLVAAPIGLFVLTRKIVCFLPRLLRVAALEAGVSSSLHVSVEVHTPLTTPLSALGILRI